jgi:hypothetical protein
MQAIRQSNNPMRTMDAFWQGQLKSKEWLIGKLESFVYTPSSIDIHGGWVGVLSSMLFQSNIPVTSIRSVDIDPYCQHVATMMNKKEEMENRFQSITADMCKLQPNTDIVINTSCEHLTQDQYNQWLTNMPTDSLLVLQSNNYVIPEHVRNASDLEDFKTQCGIDVAWAGELELPLYTRFMIIGYNV